MNNIYNIDSKKDFPADLQNNKLLESSSTSLNQNIIFFWSEIQKLVRENLKMMARRD